jgi:hypothetical protein
MAKSSPTTVTRITKDTGATIKPGPMVVAAPEQTVTDEMLQNVGVEAGLNGPFLTDQLAAMAAHENMGVNLYRVLQGLVVNPMLQGRFAQFETESLQSVVVYEQLMTRLGAPIRYISPAARMTEGLDGHVIMSFLAAGSADTLTLEMKAVEAVLLASTLCVANVSLLALLAEQVEGETQQALNDAVQQLKGPAQEHLDWARTTQERMVMTMVKHPLTQKLTQFAEDVVGKVQNALR